MTSFSYDLGGNAFFLAAYSLLILPQIYLGIRYKTWGFLFGIFSGLLLEIIGYIARVQMHYGKDQFLMYIVTLTIGPAFLSAAIYLCLARIITVYGEHLSRFRPRTYTITFIFLDFFALVLQSSGGAILGSDDTSNTDMGFSILKAGLSLHLVAIAIYVGLASEFAFSVYRKRDNWSPQFDNLQKSSKFEAFLIALAVATIAIFIRTAFRMAELSQGFDSAIARNEIAFLVLEGAMVLLACVSLTVCHPGVAFQSRWSEADFPLKRRKNHVKSPGSSDGGHVPFNSM